MLHQNKLRFSSMNLQIISYIKEKCCNIAILDTFQNNNFIDILMVNTFEDVHIIILLSNRAKSSICLTIADKLLYQSCMNVVWGFRILYTLR